MTTEATSASFLDAGLAPPCPGFCWASRRSGGALTGGFRAGGPVSLLPPTAPGSTVSSTMCSGGAGGAGAGRSSRTGCTLGAGGSFRTCAGGSGAVGGFTATGGAPAEAAGPGFHSTAATSAFPWILQNFVPAG
jgi:hypothetical protein